MALRDQLQSSLGNAYSLERELGGGGMSRVFVATENALGRSVVVKVLAPELTGTMNVGRFMREMRLAANLQHPNIVPVLATGETDGLPWFTMPFVAGETLRARLATGNTIPLAECIRILRDVAKALAYAHGQGVVHRDIKPENVLLTGDSAVVADFGIAKAVRDARATPVAPRPMVLTADGTSLGTPAYMAPEQAAGDEVDARADIYSFGIVAWEVLAGEHPFAGKRTAQALLTAQLAEVPVAISTRRADVSPALSALIAECVEKDPARRPQSAGEIAELLESVTTGSRTARMSGTFESGMMSRRVLGRSVVLSTVFVVAVIGGLWWWRMGGGISRTKLGGSVGAERSIAVLPMANVGGDSTTEWFSDGMTDEIAGVLAKVPNLRVAARTSTYVFKKKQASAAEIGKALGVSSLVEGTVRRAGDRMRVSVSLIDAATGSVRWTDEYDRQLKDVFAVQDEIAAVVVRKLELTLGGVALASARAGRTTSTEAHDLYLEGHHALVTGDSTQLRRAITLFDKAVAADPTYARAWAGIALAWGGLGDGFLTPSIAYPPAEVAADKALALDSLLPEAHAARAFTLATHEWRFAEAERGFKRALALDPKMFDVLFLASNFYCGQGRYADGIGLADRAIASDPSSPLGHWQRAGCLYSARRYDAAIAENERLRAVGPGFYYADDFGAAAYREKGEYAKALKMYDEMKKATGDSVSFGLAITYARMGRQEEATRIARLLERRAATGAHYLDPATLGLVYASLGQADRAMEWLERAYRSRASMMSALDARPELDGIRADPRFVALRRRVVGDRAPAGR